MVGLALAGALVQGASSLIGGRARKNAAKDADRAAYDTGDLIVRATREDQGRAIDYRNSDQARIDSDFEKYGSGNDLDLKRLRDESIAAGFNPLTVLGATGGAGFTTGSPTVLTTPFIPLADAFRDRANLVAGTANASIETAGYIGDALGDAGRAFMDQRNADRDYQQQVIRTEAIQRESMGINGVSPFGAPSRVVSGSRGRTASGNSAGRSNGTIEVENRYNDLGFDTETGKYQRVPMLGTSVDPWGNEIIGSNPDLDDEAMEALAVPFKAGQYIGLGLQWGYDQLVANAVRARTAVQQQYGATPAEILFGAHNVGGPSKPTRIRMNP